ncbi:MAG: DNA polymerase IV [Gracilibacteraceae bacterium]|jgi:DNA polymerase-4|nr:DNA polymerase IV [Gracilibacteraceae bacterium]
MSDRVILHCDCNSFFASVEETFSPELRRVPMAIAGDAENRRGIILAKNELAKRYKIQTAETVWSAKRKCPDLVLRPPRRGAYSEFCARVNALYDGYTDRVQRFGLDESFLDLTGCLGRFAGDALRAANDIRERVRREIGITISIGVSWNKVFAKLGSDYKKPDAVTVISRGNWKQIVFPLPVSDLFLVGEKTAEKLSEIGIRSIGDLAGSDREMLTRLFGKFGARLFINANGLDDSPVARSGETEEAKSIGNNITFRRDLVTAGDIRLGVSALADSVASRLRRAGKKCRTVQVTIKDANLKTIMRQTTLSAPTFVSAELAAAAIGLIEKHWTIYRGDAPDPAVKPIRMLGVTAENLVSASEGGMVQISLFDEPGAGRNERTERLEQTIDKIRDRFGQHAVQRASILGNDLGIQDKDEPRGGADNM